MCHRLAVVVVACALLVVGMFAVGVHKPTVFSDAFTLFAERCTARFAYAVASAESLRLWRASALVMVR